MQDAREVVPREEAAWLPEHVCVGQVVRARHQVHEDLGEENLLPSRFEVLVTESEAQDDLGVAMAVFGAMVVLPSFPLGQEPVEIELTVFFAGNDGCAASMYEKVEHILSLQQLALFEWTCEISDGRQLYATQAILVANFGFVIT